MFTCLPILSHSQTDEVVPGRRFSVHYTESSSGPRWWHLHRYAPNETSAVGLFLVLTVYMHERYYLGSSPPNRTTWPLKTNRMEISPQPTSTSISVVCPTSFSNLTIVSVVHSTLSALFGGYLINIHSSPLPRSIDLLQGVYVVLFTIAVWSTCRRHGSAYRRIRIVTIIL